MLLLVDRCVKMKVCKYDCHVFARSFKIYSVKVKEDFFVIA